MPEVRKTLNIVFDGQCEFCINSLKLLAKLDTSKLWRFADSNDQQMVARDYPQLKNADLDQAMFVVVDGEPPYRGFYAFRRMMMSTPWLLPMGMFCYLPGISLLGELAYGAIAANRRSLGCRSSVCELTNVKRDELLNTTASRKT